MVSDVIGLLSGLLAVFTFLTGTTSARELLRRAGERRAGRPTRRRRPWLVLGVSALVFVLSMVVTLNAGLDGSDTGGAQFLLLPLAAPASVRSRPTGQRATGSRTSGPIRELARWAG